MPPVAPVDLPAGPPALFLAKARILVSFPAQSRSDNMMGLLRHFALIRFRRCIRAMRAAERKHKCLNIRVLASISRAALAVALMGLVACGGGDDVITPSGEPGGTIGPNGGTATDGGAKVTIPPGALTRETAIEVTTFVDSDACPSPTGPAPGFVGGARFGPDGLQFAVPATVTIPCNPPLAPGSHFPLFVWNEVETAWEQTPFVATVAADGNSFSAQVTHFSVFGGFGTGGEGIIGDLDDQLCSGGDPASLMNGFIESFKRDIADVGDKGVYDNQCQEVTGIDFDIRIEIDGNTLSDFVREGDTSDQSIMFVYTAECVSGQSAGGYIDVTVVIYYDCSAPDLSVSADPSHVEKGESSTITASLTCGQVAYPGQTVQFECFGDGEITPEQASTNPAGQAQTMYNAPDENTQATISAYYDACAGDDNAKTLQSSAAVTVGGSWSGTMTVDFSHSLPDPPLLEFADVLTIQFEFDIDEGVITGTGTGSHSVSITPGGDCQLTSLSAPSYGFSVSGTATDETLQFSVVPNGMMPIDFVITCWFGDEPPVDFPYPPYGALEGALITSHIDISMSREDGATDSGSGSDDWGEGFPMYYSYVVTVGN
jgi:hypothetical protein